jgi:hypothetical protein
MRLEFQVPPFLQNRVSDVGGHRTRVPRASEIATSTPRVKRVIRKRSSQRSALAKQNATKANAPNNSLADLFRRQRHTQAASSSTNSPASEPKEPIEDVSAYIARITRDIASGRLNLRSNPWVAPTNPFQAAMDLNARRKSDGERLIDPSEALNLVLRPWVFVWAPEKLCPLKSEPPLPAHTLKYPSREPDLCKSRGPNLNVSEIKNSDRKHNRNNTHTTLNKDQKTQQNANQSMMNPRGVTSCSVSLSS